MWLWFKSNLTGCHAPQIETSHLDSRQTLNSWRRLSVCCYLAGSRYRCGQICWCGTEQIWMEECMKKAWMWKSRGVSHGTSHFLLNEKHKDHIRRWAARMGVQREHGPRCFTSITVQFIFLKLFFRETQKEGVYYWWDCLQCFTSHHICSSTKIQNHNMGRCHNSNKLDFCAVGNLFLNSGSHPIFLSGIILHFISMTPSRRRRQHQKRQTSNTILTQATSNEAQTVSGIKGPGRITAKLS